MEVSTLLLLLLLLLVVVLLVLEPTMMEVVSSSAKWMSVAGMASPAIAALVGEHVLAPIVLSSLFVVRKNFIRLRYFLEFFLSRL